MNRLTDRAALATSTWVVTLLVMGMGIVGCASERDASGDGGPQNDSAVDGSPKPDATDGMSSGGGGAGGRGGGTVVPGSGGGGGGGGSGGLQGSTGGGSAGTTVPPATGGAGASSQGSGGAPATGGAPASGGRVGTGGTVPPATGGAIGSGGRVATGGAIGTGGAVTTGGAVGSGGAVTTGGRVGTGGAVTTGGAVGSGGAGTGGAGAPPGVALFVVAHPDDELLFMNPDLEKEIQAGNSVLTMFLTSGDGNDPNVDWRGREQRVMAAHAAMAGVASTWTCAPATYAGKATVRCTLTGRPTVKMAFLRVLDGGIGNIRAIAATGTVGTIDGAATYTRAELLATMAAIQTELAPTRVGALDGTLAHGPEHGDHVAAGIFTFDVARVDGVGRQLAMYRGYTMFPTSPTPAPEPENLSAAEYQEKLRIMHVYQAPPLDQGFDQWCRRMYPLRSVSRGAGAVRSGSGQCLGTSGSADGAALTVATCTGAAAQNWTLGANGRVTWQNGRCLGLAGTGNGAVIEVCNASAADQRWTVIGNGQFRGTGDSCLTVTGSAVVSMPCTADMSAARYQPPVSQRWTP